jgi:hypothetical protein
MQYLPILMFVSAKGGQKCELGDRFSITGQCCDSTAQNDLQNDYESFLSLASVDALTRDSSGSSSKITYFHTVTFRKARNLRSTLYF